MPEARAQRYCPSCDAWVLSTQQRPNHVLHLLLTILLCGLWGVVWLILVLTSSGNPWLCARCGARTKTASRGAVKAVTKGKRRRPLPGAKAGGGRMSFCEDCAGEVSWNATHCEHCGARLPRRR